MLTLCYTFFLIIYLKLTFAIRGLRYMYISFFCLNFFVLLTFIIKGLRYMNLFS